MGRIVSFNAATLSEGWGESVSHENHAFVRMYTLADAGSSIDDTEEEGLADFVYLPNTPHIQGECGQATKARARGSYRRYTPQQIEKLFDLVIEQGRTAKEAGLITGINVRTAQHYIKSYNKDEERRLPGVQRKPRIRCYGKLTEAQSQFLVDYVDRNSTAILTDIKRSLCEAFEGLTISESALHRHLVNKCRINLKKLEKLPAARNSDRVIALRKEKVGEWEKMQGLDFTKNCVFIDEAGFNLHTQKKFWSFFERHTSRRHYANWKGSNDYYIRCHI